MWDMRHVVLMWLGLGIFLIPNALGAQSAGSTFEAGLQVSGLDVTPPSVPTGIGNTVLSSVPQVTVTWNASSDLNGVAYYNVFKEAVFLGSTTMTSYVDTAVVIGGTYRYTVSAIDTSDNESDRSATTTATISSGGGGGGSDDDPPTIPQNLVGVIDEFTPSVSLTWDASTDDDSGVDGYLIYRGASLIADTNLTSFVDTNVVNDASYTYTVVAYDEEDNESDASVPYVANVPALDTAPPSVPANLAATVSTTTPSVSLNWSSSTDTSGVAFYSIYRGGVLLATTTNITYLDLTVATGTTYTYTVSATDIVDNESAQTSPVSANLTVPPPGDTTAPTIPTGVAVVIDDSTPSVTINWNPATDGGSGIGGYNVYRDGALLVSVGSTTHLDLGVSNGLSYSYRVSAYDVAGNESDRSSPPVMANVPGILPPADTTSPSTPTGLAGTADRNVPHISLTWNAATDDVGVAEYNIYRAGVFLDTTSNLNYLDLAVLNDATYEYRVTAVDTSGNESSQSTQIQVYVPEEEDDPVVDPPDPTPDPTPNPGGGGGGSIFPEDEPTGATTATGTDEVVEVDPPIEIPDDEDQEEPGEIPNEGISVPGIITETIRTSLGDVTEGVNRQIQKTREMVPEDRADQAVIAVGTAVSGLVVPAIQATAAGSSIWYILLARLQDIGRLISWIFPWVGVRRRKKPWGIVYDSVTKQPLDPAYVELVDVDTGKTVTSAITDLDGRFGFSAEPGRYQLKASKTNYTFPSTRMEGMSSDIVYQNLYFGEIIEKSDDDAVFILRDIPMDPEKFDWNEFEKRRLGVMKFYSRYDRLLTYASSILFYAGLAFALLVLYLSPSLLNGGVVVLYLFIILMRKIFIKPMTKGRVIDREHNAPMSYATIKVYLPGTDRPVKTVIADELGRYYCLVQPNQYNVVVEERLSDGQYRPVFRSELIDAKEGIIDERFEI